MKHRSVEVHGVAICAAEWDENDTGELVGSVTFSAPYQSSENGELYEDAREGVYEDATGNWLRFSEVPGEVMSGLDRCTVDVRAMDAIARELDGEWSPDTLDAIARTVLGTGRTFTDVDGTPPVKPPRKPAKIKYEDEVYLRSVPPPRRDEDD